MRSSGRPAGLFRRPAGAQARREHASQACAARSAASRRGRGSSGWRAPWGPRAKGTPEAARARAAAALRRALCTDALFALAAFSLGRAYDALGDAPAARRAYERALRTIDADDQRYERMLQQVDIGDVAAACRTRLAGRP